MTWKVIFQLLEVFNLIVQKGKLIPTQLLNIDTMGYTLLSSTTSTLSHFLCHISTLGRTLAWLAWPPSSFWCVCPILVRIYRFYIKISKLFSIEINPSFLTTSLNIFRITNFSFNEFLLTFSSLHALLNSFFIYSFFTFLISMNTIL